MINNMSNANVSVTAVEQQFAKSNGNNTENNSNTKFNAKDYLDTRLKQGETTRKVKIRILPVSAEDNNFAVEIKTHSLKVDKEIADSGFKSFICLNDEQVPNYDSNVRCPLCAKAYDLFKKAKEYKQAGEPEKGQPLYDRARQLMNKSTYILRVIDRANESEGVKFWRFNKSFKGDGIFDKLRTIFENKRDAYRENGSDDNYNIFDLYNGRDIILTITRAYDKNGKELPSPSINVDANDFETPLTKDQELFDKWITDTKKWYNAYTTRTPDYLSIIADGDIPVKNSDGQWIAKSVKEEEQSAKSAEDKIVEEESKKILEKPISPKVEPKATVIYNAEDDGDDDCLPF